MSTDGLSEPALRGPGGGRIRVAFLFPGQGERRVDAAVRAAIKAPPARDLLEIAASLVGVPLSDIATKPSLLDRTEIYQPVMTALCCAACSALLDAGIEPSVVLGHSLGEVSAFAACARISAEDAILLAARRGALMAREAALHPGGMVAFQRVNVHRLQMDLWRVRPYGLLHQVANNTPDELVLSGDEPAVQQILQMVGETAVRLPVAGPWHSPNMAGAKEEWREAIANVPRSGGELRFSFISNRTGDVARHEVEIVEHLTEQLVSRIQWLKALETLRSLADAIVTVGPSGVLRSILQRNLRSKTPRIPIYSTEDARSLAETVSALRKALPA